ncbi:hypothetical protein [Streptomyces lichenis]|uniref:Sporulation delaying protein family toxin n=1 Tax=Streptomyces lichenis TaxID=2306967 RepID=A0ABT0IJ27_9ACTN|nr:hypothetical protein [Streptomyces lichenis]MCK8681327.1 hypothetical protein [Streptomyces lichenis]
MLSRNARTKRILATVAAVTAIGVGGVATSNASAAPSTGTAPVAAHRSGPAVGTVQDGRDVYAGLIFLQGDLGRKFAELGPYTGAAESYRKNDNAEARQAVAQVLDAIAEKDSGFFSAFSTQVRSGDPRKVESGMDRAVKLLTEVTVDEKDTTSPKALGAGDGRCAVLALNVLIVVNVGGAVNVSVAVNLQAWKNVINMSVAPADEGSITKDQKIADITRLAAA